MIKQKLFPNFAKYDIVNSQMPDVFLDPTAKIKIFLYKTNQKFDEMFIDENSEEQRIINFYLEKELDAWIGQNFTKQINPFQNASASKTIAMQSEIELYVLDNLQTKIENDFYFFTFSPIESDDTIKSTPKFMIKESISNLDKTKFRFSKIKAWQMSSILFKQYQYWYFKHSLSLERQKVKQIMIKYPSYAAIGNIKINGTNVLGVPPQNIDYKIISLVHPFTTLEPIACNFAYKSGNLLTQFINWDVLGKSIESLKNHYFGINGTTNRYKTVDFSTYSFGLVVYMDGATLFPLPAGALYGLAECYCSILESKNANNDLKAYFWAKESWEQATQREYYNLKKCSPINSINQYEQFFKNSTPTYSFNPWWINYDAESLGEPFNSISLPVLNEESFEISNQLVNKLPDAKQYCWLLMGQLNFYNIGVFSKRFDNRNSWTNNSYYNFGVLPWGFLSVDKVRTIFNTIRNDKNLDEIYLTINFDKSIYLNSIEINVLYADEIEVELTLDNNLKQNYKQYTNFFLVGQDNVKTKLVFF